MQSTSGSSGCSYFELRRRYLSRYKTIIKRGFIRTGKEYGLIKSIADAMNGGLPEEERVQRVTLIGNYEDEISEKRRARRDG